MNYHLNVNRGNLRLTTLATVTYLLVMLFIRLVFSSFLTLLLSTSLQAQPTVPKALVYQLNYVSVKSENQNAYEELQRSQWKPIYQKLVQQGKLVSWLLLKRSSLKSSKVKHDYLTMFTFRQADDVAEVLKGHEVMITNLTDAGDLTELNKRTRALNRVELTRRTRSFSISVGNGTGTSANWRFLRLKHMAVAMGQMDSYKAFIDNRIRPVYDAIRADSLLKSYNFSETLYDDPKGDVTVMAAQSFSTLEQAGQFQESKEIENKLGNDSAKRLMKVEMELSSTKEILMYEKIDSTIRRVQ